ncbi:MAG: SCO family protein [Deltaproteobacteria bacterium]
MKFLYLFLAFLIYYPFPSLAVEQPRPEQQASLTKSEDAVGKKIGDYRLIDQDGREFNTSEFISRPFVVSFIYTSCTYICGTITQSLSNVVKERPGGFGKDFNILTVSFNPESDTPARLKEFGSGFTKEFTKWRFATGSKETIARMTQDFGFFYKKEGNHFQHMNMVSVIGAKGNIITHVYGTEFKPKEVLNPIYYPERFSKDEKIGLSKLIDKVVLFCYKYDPSTDTYRVDYTMLMPLILGIAAPLFIILMVAHLFRGSRDHF